MDRDKARRDEGEDRDRDKDRHKDEEPLHAHIGETKHL